MECTETFQNAKLSSKCSRIQFTVRLPGRRMAAVRLSDPPPGRFAPQNQLQFQAHWTPGLEFQRLAKTCMYDRTAVAILVQELVNVTIVQLNKQNAQYLFCNGY